MQTLGYNIDLTGLKVLKTNQEQYNELFISGHPCFLIPTFNEYPSDIWTSYLDYLETIHGEIWDQDGGEIVEYNVIDKETGLTKCIYEVYGIQFGEDDEPIDITVEIIGYVVMEDDGDVYFLATMVTERSQII